MDGGYNGGSGYRGSSNYRGNYRGNSSYNDSRSGNYDGPGGARSGYQGGYQGGGRGSYHDRGGYQGGGYQDQGGYSNRGGYQGSSGRGGFHDSGYNNSWRGGRSDGGRRGGRYEGDWGRGRGRSSSYNSIDNRRRQEREEETLPADVLPAVEVPAHTKKLSAIVADAASKMLYTCSHDGTVKCWNTENGQCTSSVEVGGTVDSLLISGGFLFVGVQKAEEGIVKVWNMQTGQHHQLPGHRGQILCMHAAGGLLFSGGQDRSIRVWNFNPQAGIFMSQTIITKEEGGHDCAVHCFQSIGNFLFSADRNGSIKAWDLTTGKLAQTVEKAHNEAITHLLIWESFLLTSATDGYVKAWQIQETPLPNLVIKPEPEFAFNKDMADDGAQQQQGRRTSTWKSAAIFTMAGTLDAAGTPILMISYLNETFIRLYELPTFASRGVLTPAPETRCLSMMLCPDFSKGHMMIAGDAHGKLRIFGWKAAVVAADAAVMQ